MVDKIYYPQPIVPVKPASEGSKQKVTDNAGQAGFKEILKSQLSAGDLKLSAHAKQRLESRNINLTAEDVAKINNAVNKAAQKGSKDSLILMKDLAFVVSVKNKTIITAVDNSHMKEHVFTNIDSAVIV